MSVCIKMYRYVFPSFKQQYELTMGGKWRWGGRRGEKKKETRARRRKGSDIVLLTDVGKQE